MAIMSEPRSRAIRYEDNDISATANSAYLSCRQNVSEAGERVVSSVMPSGSTLPSNSGAVRSFRLEMNDIASRGIGHFLATRVGVRFIAPACSQTRPLSDRSNAL